MVRHAGWTEFAIDGSVNGGWDRLRHKRVFETGVSSATDRQGLGLGIVRRLADAHGWAITVTDGTDGGARFEITGVTPAERTA